MQIVSIFNLIRPSFIISPKDNGYCSFFLQNCQLRHNVEISFISFLSSWLKIGPFILKVDGRK